MMLQRGSENEPETEQQERYTFGWIFDCRQRQAGNNPIRMFNAKQKPFCKENMKDSSKANSPVKHMFELQGRRPPHPDLGCCKSRMVFNVVMLQIKKKNSSFNQVGRSQKRCTHMYYSRTHKHTHSHAHIHTHTYTHALTHTHTNPHSHTPQTTKKKSKLCGFSYLLNPAVRKQEKTCQIFSFPKAFRHS